MSYLNTNNSYQGFNFQPMQQPTSRDERLWVQGEDAARAYLMAPNSFVRLWDSTSPVFYEKSTDSTGRPYMDVYEYKKKDAPKQVSIDERFNEVFERLDKLEAQDDQQSYAVNKSVQTVRSELSREPARRSSEASEFGQNYARTAEPGSTAGNRVSGFAE